MKKLLTSLKSVKSLNTLNSPKILIANVINLVINNFIY